MGDAFDLVVGAFDEALGEAEACAELLFAAGHFAVVGFVVVAGEMEETMEDEDLQFTGEGVALIGGLAAGGFHADGQIAGHFFLALDEILGGERKHVGGFVFASELAVEAADGGVGGEEYGDVSAEADGLLGFSQETGKRWLGRILRGQGTAVRFRAPRGATTRLSGVGSGSRSGSMRIILRGAATRGTCSPYSTRRGDEPHPMREGAARMNEREMRYAG